MSDLTHATPELFAALAAAQGEIENASKNANNPHFRSRYADLAEVLNTIRPVFAARGLSITQSPAFDGELASVTTVIAHASGGYIVSKASCVPAKSDAQGIGSATTYLRRYSAAALAGIAQEDDDGESAAHDRQPVVDITAWRDAIAGAADRTGLDALAKEIQAANLPQAALRNVRALWAAKAKELAA